MNKMFVGNLAFAMSEDDLTSLFNAHGTVTEVLMPTDRMTGKPRGFAFVSLSTEAEVAAAVEALNGTDQQGRQIVVNVAQPKKAWSDKPRFH